MQRRNGQQIGRARLASFVSSALTHRQRSFRLLVSGLVSFAGKQPKAGPDEGFDLSGFLLLSDTRVSILRKDGRWQHDEEARQDTNRQDSLHSFNASRPTPGWIQTRLAGLLFA